jgi:hypothetical protein
MFVQNRNLDIVSFPLVYLHTLRRISIIVNTMLLIAAELVLHEDTFTVLLGEME